MKGMNRTVCILSLGLITGFGYALWRRAKPKGALPTALPSTGANRLLERAAPLLRLPTSPESIPEVLRDGSGMRCPVSGRTFPYHNGVLDLLDSEQDTTSTQDFHTRSLTAWVYDRFRGWLARVRNSPAFPVEVSHIQQTLMARPGDTILDLACGHGNFTIEWAKRVGPEGLVIGLDISPSMLARAARRVDCWGLHNILLIRGDAHRLPFGDGVLRKVNCSGGFHQFSDLPRAIGEIARSGAEGAVLTASVLSEGPDDRLASLKRWMKHRLNRRFVPLDLLGEQLAAAGYEGYEWTMPGGWFGYISSHKGSGRA